ncbi:RNA methyltransferase, TrmH family [Anaerobranca californiensis DSM 14826]|uniref:RNA methyltransferase, TrmH family n=1 Tax=Anaerobranca californiensis DSM 14826 TaxID=1120989 RepID=A0A1M6PT78_9FIRM|nr:RNA methyltransferase, TrmH family [Anaerobranca californiensis DSM 14826]
MVLVTSINNKIVKEIIEIKKKGKKSKSPLLFFEGLRLVEDILSSGAKVEKLIIREGDLEKYLHLVQGKPYVVLENKVFKEISGTVNSQGIGLLAYKPTPSELKPPSLALAVDGVQDPGNLGTIIRTAVAAGVNSIFLLKGTVDLYNEKVLRSTMGALYKIPIYIDWEIEDIKKIIDKYSLIPLKTSVHGEYLYNNIPKGRYLVFVGNEGNGLSQQVENLPGITVKIPLYGDIESLNVAVATGIILYGIKN